MPQGPTSRCYYRPHTAFGSRRGQHHDRMTRLFCHFRLLWSTIRGVKIGKENDSPIRTPQQQRSNWSPHKPTLRWQLLARPNFVSCLEAGRFLGRAGWRHCSSTPAQIPDESLLAHPVPSQTPSHLWIYLQRDTSQSQVVKPTNPPRFRMCQLNLVHIYVSTFYTHILQ